MINVVIAQLFCKQCCCFCCNLSELLLSSDCVIFLLQGENLTTNGKFNLSIKQSVFTRSSTWQSICLRDILPTLSYIVLIVPDLGMKDLEFKVLLCSAKSLVIKRVSSGSHTVSQHILTWEKCEKRCKIEKWYFGAG